MSDRPSTGAVAALAAGLVLGLLAGAVAGLLRAPAPPAARERDGSAT